MRRFLLLGSLIALASCGPAQPPSVSIVGHAFEPETLTIQVGDEVKWENNSDELHTVTAVESSLPEGAAYFASDGSDSEDEALETLKDELLEPGVTYERGFSEPGTYRYYCIPHRAEGMEGSIVVKE